MQARLSASDRVTVAKDALSWLRVGALTARSGIYVMPARDDVSRIDILNGVADKKRTQIRDVVFGPCEVCVVGALLVASVVRFDSCTVDDFIELHPKSLLGRWFDDDQVNLMEYAFEWHSPSGYGQQASGYGQQARAFGMRFHRAGERLEAILQNVIDHGGDFVP